MANYYRDLEDSGANYEEEEAQLWREPIYSRQRQRFDGHSHNNDAISSHIRRMPDEVWLIPANIDAKKILGEKKANLQRIEASTNTHMNYNESDAQIEMWGNRDELAEAIKQWNTLAQNILDVSFRTLKSIYDDPSELYANDELRRTREARKAREEKNKSAWAKPEKELTEKQRRKLKRREERAAKEKEMAGPNFPRDRMPYNAHFVLPTNNEIPIEQILGDKEDVLNSIRMDTNCYMFYDPVLKLVKIAGNESDLVEEAAMRVKVLYLKSVARNGWVHHMIDIPDIPRQPYRVKIANLPDSDWFMPPHDVDTKTAIKIFEPVRDGDPTTLGKENDSKESSVDLETLQRIQLENVEGIKNALLQALGLFEVVSQGEQQWEGSPFREYKIRAYMRPKSRGDPKLDCVFDVKFKNDNKIGLWNATMTERNSQISPNNKLIYTNTEDIVVTSVCEKLKWKFWWGENYVIEITRYEHWNCDKKFQSIDPGVEIVLGREPSERTFFDTWERDFAENCNLSSGRVPEWHPIDFVEEE
ncbi:17512_t:CDS:10, partial [Racocetra fulgida]